MDSNISKTESISDESLSNEDCCIIDVKSEVVSLSSDGSDIVLIKEERRLGTRVSEMEDNDNSVLISSDDFSDNFVDDLSINIQSDTSDGQVSDVNTEVTVKWNTVESPKGWTKTMKRYYNKPCKSQRYFDWKKELQEIRSGPPSNWAILTSDIYPSPVRSKRCLICRQTDHLSKRCPRRNGSCTMCGDTGHTYYRCPRTMCLNCGTQRKNFIDFCGSCSNNRIKCTGCKKYGHESKNCPDLWRRFHRTVEFKEINSTTSELNNNIQCCNCAKAGHLFEECTENFWSSYMPTSFLVTNYKDYKSDNQNSSHSKGKNRSLHRNDRKHLKRPQYDSSDEEYTSSKQIRLNQHMYTSMRQKLWMAFTDPLSVFQRKEKKSKKKKKKKTSSVESNIL